MEEGENKLIQSKSVWLEICAVFFRDGVEKMMRDEICCVFFHVIN